MVINHVYRIPLGAIRGAFIRNKKQGLFSTEQKIDIHSVTEESIKPVQYCFRELDTLYPTKRRTILPTKDGTVIDGTGSLFIHRCDDITYRWKTELACMDKESTLIELRSCEVRLLEWTDGDYSRPQVTWLENTRGSYVLVYYVTRHGVVASWYTDNPAEARCMYMRAILGECA